MEMPRHTDRGLAGLTGSQFTTGPQQACRFDERYLTDISKSWPSFVDDVEGGFRSSAKTSESS
jgi:hypothetical protein